MKNREIDSQSARRSSKKLWRVIPAFLALTAAGCSSNALDATKPPARNNIAATCDGQLTGNYILSGYVSKGEIKSVVEEQKTACMAAVEIGEKALNVYWHHPKYVSDIATGSPRDGYLDLEMTDLKNGNYSEVIYSFPSKADIGVVTDIDVGILGPKDNFNDASSMSDTNTNIGWNLSDQTTLGYDKLPLYDNSTAIINPNEQQLQRDLATENSLVAIALKHLS